MHAVLLLPHTSQYRTCFAKCVADPFDSNSNDDKGASPSPLSLYKNACKSNGADNQAEHDRLLRDRGERLVQTIAIAMEVS